MLLVLVALLLPDAAPLLGMFCFGNLMRVSGVVERLSDTAQNALINIITLPQLSGGNEFWINSQYLQTLISYCSA